MTGTSRFIGGHVYFAITACGRYVKIGLATNPAARIRKLRGTAPPDDAVFPMRLLVDRDDTMAGEFATHRAFESLRLRPWGSTGNEWFRAEPPLMDFIATLANEPALSLSDALVRLTAKAA